MSPRADELLRELVACKDLKERCAALAMHGLCLANGKEREAAVDEYSMLQDEYARRQPTAWSAARAYLNEKQPATAPGAMPIDDQYLAFLKEFVAVGELADQIGDPKLTLEEAFETYEEYVKRRDALWAIARTVLQKTD